jgi:hypothetical protein
MPTRYDGNLKERQNISSLDPRANNNIALQEESLLFREESDHASDPVVPGAMTAVRTLFPAVRGRFTRVKTIQIQIKLARIRMHEVAQMNLLRRYSVRMPSPHE